MPQIPDPRVSVLLPVRNGADHLPEAAHSISRQTFDDFEVLAVDDGSVDATPGVLDAWAARDERVRVLSQPAQGLVLALERARAEARGVLLARMDADDRAHPARLERQVRLLETRPDVGLCGTHVRYFPPAAVRAGARRYQAWLNGLRTSDELDRDLFVECPLAHPTFLMRTELVDAVGGYADRGWPEDYDLLLRVRESGARLAVVPEVLHDWREGDSRRSRTHPAYSRAAFRRCKAFYLERMRLGGCDELWIWGAGPTGKAMGRALLEEGLKLQGWIDVDPRKIGQEIHGATVFPPDELAPAPGRVVLSAVGRPAARQEVREALADLGFQEPHDAVAVA